MSGLTFVSPIDCTPATTGSWQDVDLDTHIASLPTGTSGVLLRAVNTATDAFYQFGVRKNGSTTDVRLTIDYNDGTADEKVEVAIGVDANNIFEIHAANKTNLKFYIIGYFGTDFTFLTNEIDIATASDSWTDYTLAEGSIGVIMHSGGPADDDFGIRKNGSTDARIDNANQHNPFLAFCGCDANRIIEFYTGNHSMNYVLVVGYVTANATFNTNATDKSLSSTGSWTDLAALPAGAIAGIFETIQSTYTYAQGIRKNGSSDESDYKEILYHHWQIVECDTSQLVEGKISNAACDFFLVGYLTAAPGVGRCQVIII
jgi:hypothetical protein